MKRYVASMAVALGLAGLASIQAGEIHDAAAAGDVSKVEALLKANPDLVNLRELGTTPLHEAARNGQLAVVKLLVQRGASLNVKDSSNCTPLKLALGYQRKEVATWLRQAGALETVPAATPAKAPAPVTPVKPVEPVTPEPAAPAPSREPAPAAPVPITPEPMVRPPAWAPVATNAAPAAKPPPNAAAVNPGALNPVIFPIHAAAEVGDLDQVKALLKDWPELMEAENEKGQRPLHVAAAQGRKDVAEALLVRRANVEARTKYGWSPIHFAAMKGDPSTVTLLLAYGAQPNVTTRTEETPLHLAVRGNHLEAATILVRHKANVNAVEKTSSLTPLHLAAEKGSLPLVELLVSNGAQPSAINGYGETPLSLALAGGNTALIQYLKNHGAVEPPAKPLTPTEQSLVDAYRRIDQALQHGSPAEKRKVALEIIPTRADAQRLFPKNAAAAVKVVDELQQATKAALSRGTTKLVEEGTIWRLQPGPPSPYVQQCQNKGVIATDVPIHTLLVAKIGQKEVVEVYCYVNNHWVHFPPLGRILPE